MADLLREAFWAKIRELHRAPNTGKAYWQWIEAFCDSHRDKAGRYISPRTLGKKEVQDWLSDLANKGVSESAHEQAFYALLFLYNKVYDQPLKDVRAERPKPKVNVPVVMTHDEVARVIDKIQGSYKLLAQLMYGCGLRRSEALSLRLKDIDIGNRQIIIWHSKHKHSRTVPLPQSIVPQLQRKIDESLGWQKTDFDNRTGGIIIPRGKVENRKASFDPKWYWLFCSAQLSRDPESQRIARYHLDDKHLGDRVTEAARDAGLLKRITCHTFRHSYATHLLMIGVDIRTIQRLLGHRDVNTTMIYTHVSLVADQVTPNPLDRLAITSHQPLRLAGGLDSNPMVSNRRGLVPIEARRVS